MVKIKYIGLRVKPISVNVLGSMMNWNKDEVKDISEDVAKKLTENPEFIIVKEKVIEKPTKLKRLVQ